MTQKDADDLFQYFVDKEFAPSVDSSVGNDTKVNEFNQQNFDALVSFTYNVGKAAVGKSTLLKKVKEDPKDKTIRDEFNKWVKQYIFKNKIFYFYFSITRRSKWAKIRTKVWLIVVKQRPIFTFLRDVRRKI